MTDVFPTIRASIQQISSELATGGLGLLVFDLTPLAVIEEKYGSQVFQKVRHQSLQLLKQQCGKAVREKDAVFLNEPDGLRVIFLLERNGIGHGLLSEQLRSLREDLERTLLPMIARLALPYFKSLPRFSLGQALAIHNPLIHPVRLLARAVSEALEYAALQQRIADMQVRERMQDIVVGERILTAYQPIFELPGRQVFGYEALSRGAPGCGLESAVALFAAAEEHSLLNELDRLCRRRALLLASRLPATTNVFVNILPAAIRDPEFKGKYLADFLEGAGLPPQRIVIEITERLVIENHGLFEEEMSYYTNLGMCFAIDDVGAGYSGLETIAGLRPAFLKIDMSLIRDLQSSLTKREMVSAILSMGNAIGARVIAEGIQSNDELRSVESLGVELGQGYILGRPTTVY